MKTDVLIDELASRAHTIGARAVVYRYAAAVAVGTAVAALAMATTLGPRHDFASAVMLPMFWVKLAFVASLAVLGVLVAFRAGVPARLTKPVAWRIAGIVAAMWALAVVVLAASPRQAWAALFFGATWTVCPWLISALSLPVFVAMAWAIKGMAPTRMRQAGAAAGFASGALAALVYAIHCPELGAPFLGTWYVAGILVPTGIGAFLGERLFRW